LGLDNFKKNNTISYALKTKVFVRLFIAYCINFMDLNFLKNKKIGILGLGMENQALVKYLLKHKVKCEITVCDARPGIKNKLPVQWQLGQGFNQGLEKFDILFRSPGWPIDCSGIIQSQNTTPPAHLVRGMLTSPMKLFFDLCPSKNIIGVTGTKGKGTTASLIYEILKTAGKRVWLGGNIGVAPFEFIDKIKNNDWVVLELSSFQLEDMTVSPRIAVITNLYSEHLAPADPNNPNYHKSLEDYFWAKWNIARWQSGNDYLLANSNLKTQISKLKLKSQILFFFKFDLPSKLVGEHNQENIGAASAVAKIAGVKPEIIKKAVASFKGLEHRIELARELNSVKYYDDSFATTPEATIVALKSFIAPVVLLLGGADKGADFKELALETRKRCKFVILLAGQATARIEKELLKAGFDKNNMKLVGNMKEAVAAARRQASAGDIVLLSTACASFGMFKNYKERGDLFKAEASELK
jgi:UDP-N-acetylmuramoylalanine--D-glutamate ligase